MDICCKNCNAFFEKRKINKKEAEDGNKQMRLASNKYFSFSLCKIIILSDQNKRIHKIYFWMKMFTFFFYIFVICQFFSLIPSLSLYLNISLAMTCDIFKMFVCRLKFNRPDDVFCVSLATCDEWRYFCVVQMFVREREREGTLSV